MPSSNPPVLSSVRIRGGTLAATIGALSLLVACGGGSSTPAPTPQPSAPYSQTDLTVGTGAEAAAGKRVTVNYILWLYDPTKPDQKGTLIQNSRDTGSFSFVLGGGQVIPGWERGVPGMKVGGSRRLVVPPDLAYGAAGNGPIPPNATLVFDIDLVNVE